MLDTAGTDYAAAPFPGGTAISNRITLGTGWTRASGALAPGDDFDRFRDAAEDTAYADVRLAASRRFSPRPARRAHAGRHGRPPARPRDRAVGRAAAPRVPSHPPPTRVGDGLQRRQRLHARARASVTAASMIAELPAAGRRGAAARLRGAGQPVRQHLRAGLPAHGRRPAALRAPSSSPARSCGAPPTPCASWVEADPDALPPCARVLEPVEDELWAEADDVLGHPARWAERGRVVGRPGAATRLRSCIP